MKKRKKWPIIVSPAFALLAICALYNGLTVREYFLASPQIKEPVTLVLISDLHNSRFGKNQKDIIGLIKKQSPDCILITGDIVDDIEKTENAKAFLLGIKGICPVYYVTGNHEYWTRQISDIRDMVTQCGGVILSDTFEVVEVKGNRILVAGIEDPDKQLYEDAAYSQQKAMQTSFGGIAKREEYKVLLAHRPERIGKYLPYGFDLIVSGHAHGGQVRIPFLLNGLYSPSQGLFPKLAGGQYNYDDTTLIVSRGTSFRWITPRVFNPPEVVVIRLSGE